MAKTKKKPARGRPPIKNRADAVIAFRVTKDDHVRYSQAAQAAGMTISAWFKSLADRES